MIVRALLVGYNDSDMVGDVDDRKSTSGMIYFVSGGAICWQSTKHKVVALSSCEAEYIAASMAATQGIWLARLIEELIGRESGSTNAIRRQQSYDLPDQKSSFARPEQAHEN